MDLEYVISEIIQGPKSNVSYIDDSFEYLYLFVSVMSVRPGSEKRAMGVDEEILKGSGR